MIYDKPIHITKLPHTAGTLLQGEPVPVLSAFCGEMTVFHSRFWESVQAGSRIDLMVQLPLHRKEIRADMYAEHDGQLYRITQVQFQLDADQMPVTVLSMQMEE